MNSTLKTFILMAGMTGLFLVAGQALGGEQGMMLALFLALSMNFFAYWFSDKMALAMSGAREVTYVQAPELHTLIGRLAEQAGLPKPRVYVISSRTPNAFATGRNPAHSAVAVTEGLLSILNWAELEGVIAHELAHIKNRDILISSIAAVMAGAISYLASMAQWAMIFGGFRGSDDDGDSGPGLLGGLVIMIVAPLAAGLIQMAISRSREYMADATGAKISGRPQALASALKRLEEFNNRLPMQVNPATAQMYIVNPLSGDGVAHLFSTHPPVAERIRRLMSMG
ncbi:MAG: zinc metalloprotease HtpX [Proteobacteria bacterium]|nr:zinc metalloprotease HtpX [Pseudomonadota bacterium]